MRMILASLVVLSGPAWAGVEEAVDEHLLPGYAGFALATEALAAATQADCAPETWRPALAAAFDAWGPVADIRLGPAETAALSIAFWPDERGATARALAGLVAGDPAALEPQAYAQGSIAARGLFALDASLDLPKTPEACAVERAIAADLAAQAEALARDWEAEAAALTSAGAEGNARYMTEDEAFRALYTQILTGLEFTADTRLGRPLGEFDRPRPTRAEAWRSGRPLPNALASAEAGAALALLLADAPLPATEAALASVRQAAAAIADPTFQDIDDPQARLRVEILQQRVRALRSAIEAEVGAPRGIAAGFNSQDGD